MDEELAHFRQRPLGHMKPIQGHDSHDSIFWSKTGQDSLVSEWPLHVEKYLAGPLHLESAQNSYWMLLVYNISYSY